MSDDIEIIRAEGTILCYIIRRTFLPSHTTFITPPESKQQVGFVVYPKDGKIARHSHRSLERHLVGLSEVLLVREGHCQIEIYDNQHHLVATRDLIENDVVIMEAGGHGFRIIEDTVLLEIKQGPYLGVNDKELF
jgi:mannose-6-phosphate isomerase-like protein (cupin superfamily)